MNKSPKVVFNSVILQLFFMLLLISSCENQKEKDAAEFFNRGVYAFKKNDLDNALRFFHEAANKNPEFADVYNNIGLVFEKKGEYSKALVNYEKAIEIDVSFTQATFNLGRINVFLNQPNNALELFDKVENTYKDSTDFYVERGQAYIQLSKLDKAKSDLLIAQAKQPQNALILTNLGLIAYLNFDFIYAEKLLLEAISINLKEATALNNLSVIYAELNLKEKALSYSAQAIKIDPNNKIYKNNHIYNLLINNKLKEAEIILTSLKFDLQENSYYQRNLGVFFFLKKNYLKAKEAFIKSEKLDASTRMIYYYLGRNEAQLKNTQEAKTYLQKGAYLKDSLAIKELFVISN